MPMSAAPVNAARVDDGGARFVVSVVIATYQRAHLLDGLFEALVAQRTPSDLLWEVVVVDNNSSDDTRPVLEGLLPRLPVPGRYVFEANQGMSHARNRGIREAQGVMIGILDDDVLPAPDWVAALAKLTRELDADGLGGQILPSWEAPPPRWLAEDWRLQTRLFALMKHPARRQLAYPMDGDGQIWGSNMAFRKAVFEEVGYFDTHHGRGGGKLYKGSEEYRFINKALQAGKRMFYDPTLIVHHRIGADRMSERFMRKFFFDTGEGDAMMDVGSARIRLAGAPLWVYRRAGTDLLAWVARALLLRRDAFDKEREFLYDWGLLSGYRKKRRGTDPT